MKIKQYIPIFNVILILACAITSITNVIFLSLVCFEILSVSCLPYVILGTGIVTGIVMFALLLEFPVMVMCNCIDRCKKRYEQTTEIDDSPTKENARKYNVMQSGSPASPERTPEITKTQFTVSVVDADVAKLTL